MRKRSSSRCLMQGGFNVSAPDSFKLKAGRNSGITESGQATKLLPVLIPLIVSDPDRGCGLQPRVGCSATLGNGAEC